MCRTNRRNAGVLAVLMVSSLLLSGCGRDVVAPGRPAAKARSSASGSPMDLPAGLGSSGSSGATVSEWVLLMDADADIAQVAADHGLSVVSVLGEASLALLRGAGDPEELRADPRVQSVQPNEEVVVSEPVDLVMGFYEGDWAEGDYPAQDGLDDLDLSRIHPVVDGSGVTIVVLDTGADFSHPHLADRLQRSPIPFLDQDENEPNGIDDDGDGQVDEAHGHGTHVAGIVATMAPGADVVPIRVLDDDGVGTAYQLAVGLHQSLWLGADVVNLSLSLSAESTVVTATLEHLSRAGVTIVAAAGNSGGAPRYPATDPSTVGVAALVSDTILAEFSARGGVPLGAPGVGIVSSYPGGRLARASGTSMACAVVTGALALVRSGTAQKTGSDPLFELLRTARPVSPSASVVYGAVSPVHALGLGKAWPVLRGSPLIRVTGGL